MLPYDPTCSSQTPWGDWLNVTKISKIFISLTPSVFFSAPSLLHQSGLALRAAICLLLSTVLPAFWPGSFLVSSYFSSLVGGGRQDSNPLTCFTFFWHSCAGKWLCATCRAISCKRVPTTPQPPLIGAGYVSGAGFYRRLVSSVLSGLAMTRTVPPTFLQNSKNYSSPLIARPAVKGCGHPHPSIR